MWCEPRFLDGHRIVGSSLWRVEEASLWDRLHLAMQRPLRGKWRKPDLGEGQEATADSAGSRCLSSWASSKNNGEPCGLAAEVDASPGLGDIGSLHELNLTNSELILVQSCSRCCLWAPGCTWLLKQVLRCAGMEALPLQVGGRTQPAVTLQEVEARLK